MLIVIKCSSSVPAVYILCLMYHAIQELFLGESHHTEYIWEETGDSQKMDRLGVACPSPQICPIPIFSNFPSVKPSALSLKIP